MGKTSLFYVYFDEMILCVSPRSVPATNPSVRVLANSRPRHAFLLMSGLEEGFKGRNRPGKDLVGFQNLGAVAHIA